VLTITVTWDEAVVTSDGTLALANGDTASYSSGSGTTAIEFTTTIAEDDTTSTDLSVSSYGGTIADSAGGAAGAAAGDLGAVTVDGDAPDFSSVAATDGAYGVGDLLTITVTWDEAVVTSDGTLALDNGDTASYSSGSGTTAIVFTTTIAEDDTTSTDLSVSSYGGTIADAAGGAAGAASGDLGSVTVDGDAPDLSSVAATDGAYGVGDVLTITVTWDEAVVTSDGTLALDNGDTASYSSGSGTTAIVFTTTIAEDDTTSTDLSVSSYGGTIADAAGGAAGAASGDLGAVTVDGDAPDFSSVAATDGAYGVGDVLTITVTWDEAVVTSDGTRALDNGDTASYSSGSGTTAIVFTTTIAEDDTTSSDLSVSSYGGTIADAAGGAAGAASGDLGAVTVDGDAPDFSSVAATDGTYGIGDIAPLLEFTIESSTNLSDWEIVESVDTDDGIGDMAFTPDAATPSKFFRVVVEEIEE